MPAATRTSKSTFRIRVGVFFLSKIKVEDYWKIFKHVIVVS